MAAFSTIRCTGCGQLNRHATDIGRAGTFTCGKCGRTLLLVASTGSKKQAGGGSRLGPFLAAIFVIGGAYASYENWKRAQPAVQQPVAKETLPPAARPKPADVANAAAAKPPPLPAPLSSPVPAPAPAKTTALPFASPPVGLDISAADIARNNAAKPAIPPVAPPARDPPATVPQVATAPAAPARELKLLATPRTGVIQSGPSRGGSAPFKLITAHGGDYFVKLVNVSRPRDQVTIFVRGGETFETKMPLGEYKFRAATGVSWYGHEDLFGPDTRFFGLRDKGPRLSSETMVLRFYKSGNRIYGSTIQLQAVLDGNLEQQSMSRSEFNAE